LCRGDASHARGQPEPVDYLYVRAGHQVPGAGGNDQRSDPLWLHGSVGNRRGRRLDRQIRERSRGAHQVAARRRRIEHLFRRIEPGARGYLGVADHRQPGLQRSLGQRGACGVLGCDPVHHLVDAEAVRRQSHRRASHHPCIFRPHRASP